MAASLALLKYRLYRISDCARLHVVMELLERARWDPLQGGDVAQFMRAADAYCRREVSTLDIAAVERLLRESGYSLDNELAARKAYAAATREAGAVRRLVHIVGAPRSGTSFLYYRLAHSGRFAYFTSDSHHDWYAYGLRASTKTPFENLDRDALAEDTKSMRGHADLLFPSEAEQIWHRTVPCYEHVGLHTYVLQSCKIQDMDKLTAAIREHCSAQKRDVFLSKSPFNILRMSALEDIAAAGGTRFIHISRDADACVASMTRNGFVYALDPTTPMSSRDARAYLEAEIARTTAGCVRHVRYEDILHDDAAIDDLIAWAVADG